MSDFQVPDTPSTGQAATPALPLLDLPHSVPTSAAPHTTWHCGDPFTEQRAAERAGYLDLRHLGVLHISGEDAPSWLNSLLAQKVDDLSPTTAPVPFAELRRGYVLDSNGRIEFETWVACGSDGYLLATPRAELPALQRYLQQMVFWSKVSILECDLAVVALTGTEITSPALQQDLTAVLDALSDGSDAARVQLCAVGKPRGLHLIMGFVAPSHTTKLSTILSKHNFTPSGRWTWDALRVVHGIPEIASDADSRTLPHEFDSVGAPASGAGASTTKGCYRGQETVAKIHNVGLPPRRQVVLLLDGSSETRPASGTRLVDTNGKEVGRCGTVVDHWEYGPVALGLVRRTVSDEETLRWETAEGSGTANILAELSYHPEEHRNARDTVQNFRKAARKRQL